MARRKMGAVDALKMAIARERGSGRAYCQAAERAEDPDAKKMFLWLAREERRHLARLTRQLRSVAGHDRWVRSRKKEPVVAEDIPPAPPEVGERVEAGADELDALRIAIESEQESLKFYRDAEEATPDLHGKAMFRLLAGEEEGHLAILEAELEWLKKARKHLPLHRLNLRSQD